MSAFRVALSGDFRKPDGSPVFPEMDLGPLEQQPNLEIIYLETEDVIGPGQLEDIDALILLAHRISAESFPGNKRLSLIAPDEPDEQSLVTRDLHLRDKHEDASARRSANHK